MRPLMLICLFPFLANCATVTKSKIPPELLVECPKPTYQWDTTADIIRESEARGLALDECNATRRAYK